MKFVVWEALRGLQKSLPVRERGLKYFNELPEAAKEKVAPRAGAWIEILPCGVALYRVTSLPVRERGLKL